MTYRLATSCVPKKAKRNLFAIARLMPYIREKLKEGYLLCSMDEAGFGSKPLARQSWTKKGYNPIVKIKKVKN